MAAISCQRVCLFLSLWLLLLGDSRCERASVWTEKELYQSELWKEESRSLFAVKQGGKQLCEFCIINNIMYNIASIVLMSYIHVDLQ